MLRALYFESSTKDAMKTTTVLKTIYTFINKNKIARRMYTRLVKLNIRLMTCLGKAELEIVDFNFKHFPGEIEQKVKPSINNSLKDFGINLNPKGLRVIFKDLSFKKIKSNSVNCSYEFEIEE
jgi:ribosomal protein L31E